MADSAVRRHAFARAGLLGNPSDGYYGRTLSVTLKNFSAVVTLEESPELRIEPDAAEDSVFGSVQDLVDAVTRQGYYGGARLLKATTKKLAEHCARRDVALPRRNFTARYQSSIPRQVGLAGSSAIVTAMLRALLDFFELSVSREEQATLVWSVETEELGITAGLQDRVVQVYEGLVYMDFSRDLLEARGYGEYVPLDATVLPPLYVAYQPQPTKVSGRLLNDLRSRWEQGDPHVHATLTRIAELATRGRDALLERREDEFAALMNENFDLRRRIMHVSDQDLRMIERARALGLPAKLTGSGGAILGICPDDATLERLTADLGAVGATVVRAVTT